MMEWKQGLMTWWAGRKNSLLEEHEGFGESWWLLYLKICYKIMELDCFVLPSFVIVMGSQNRVECLPVKLSFLFLSLKWVPAKSLVAQSILGYQVLHFCIRWTMLDLHNPWDAIWAAGSCAWHGCNQLGEFILKKCNQGFNQRFHVSRKTQCKFGRAQDGRWWFCLFIPWLKTARFKGEWLTFTSTQDNLDCISTFENHLKINHLVPDDAPLFTYQDPDSPSTSLLCCVMIWWIDAMLYGSQKTYLVFLDIAFALGAPLTFLLMESILGLSWNKVIGPPKPFYYIGVTSKTSYLYSLGTAWRSSLP